MRKLIPLLLFLFSAPAYAVTVDVGVTCDGACDYSTIQACEDDLDDSGVFTTGQPAICELYADAAFDEEVVFNGGGVLNVSYAEITAADGEAHDGTAGTGARIVKTTTLTTAQGMIAMSNVSGIKRFVNFVELDANGQTAAATQYVMGLTLSSGSVASQMIIHGLDSSSGEKTGVILNGMDEGVGSIVNNIIYNIGRTAGTGSAECNGIDTGGVGTWTNKTLNIYGNTTQNIFGVGTAAPRGYRISDQAEISLKNNIGMDTTGGSGGPQDFATLTNPDMSNNLSSDTTAPGTDSITEESSGDIFVSTTLGAEDLHLKTGAAAIDAGVDLSTTPAGVNIDIDGRDRDAQGDVWDIGADEFVSAGAAFTPRGGVIFFQ